MIFWKRVKQAVNDLWYPRCVTVGLPVETQELASRIARFILGELCWILRGKA